MSTDTQLVTTLCWKCDEEYPSTVAKCPNCNACNANVNTDAAMFQSQVFELERELAAETEKVKRLREALEKLVERNYQYNGVEARARFGSHDEAVSTVNHARATLEATK